MTNKPTNIHDPEMIKECIHGANESQRRVMEEAEKSNLWKIKKAEAMGWSATIKHPKRGILQVVYASANFVGGLADEYTRELYDLPRFEIEKCKITGYKYAGELGGNEKIPEGMRFRVKDTEQVFDHYISGEPLLPDEIRLQTVPEGLLRDAGFDGKMKYNKSEIEPYFE